MREEARILLDWYDVHARIMPWRIPPDDRKSGTLPDPYRIWLSEVMLQQTTVAAVREYFRKFTDIWPDVQSLAAAEDADVMAAWAGLGYYARARNLLKCARAVVANYDGIFPDTEEDLLTLPGVGPYTAAAIASIAFDRVAVVLDGNVERVMSRLHNDATPLPAAKPVFYDYAAALTPDQRPGDYAQAVMDLGATICTPRNPACGICPWREHCVARFEGTAPTLPQKTPKKKVPTKRGHAYVARTANGDWILETRPEKGMLGGMLGFPTSAWDETLSDSPPFPADWQRLDGQVRHTFTHFHLHLDIQIAVLPVEFDETVMPTRCRRYADNAFLPADLPTLMRKVFDLADATLRSI